MALCKGNSNLCREQNKMLSQLLCTKSTSSNIPTKQTTHGPESKLLQTSNGQRLKMQIISYTHARENNTCFAMTDVMSSFSPEFKKSCSSLHWDSIPFFVESNQSDNLVKENLKTLNRTKEAKKKSKSDLASCYFLVHVIFSCTCI